MGDTIGEYIVPFGPRRIQVYFRRGAEIMCWKQGDRQIPNDISEPSLASSKMESEYHQGRDRAN